MNIAIRWESKQSPSQNRKSTNTAKKWKIKQRGTEIERTLRAKLIAEKLAQASTLEVKETLADESMEGQNNPPPPPRQTMR
jgi:hypothetical protein